MHAVPGQASSPLPRERGADAPHRAPGAARPVRPSAGGRAREHRGGAGRRGLDGAVGRELRSPAASTGARIDGPAPSGSPRHACSTLKTSPPELVCRTVEPGGGPCLRKPPPLCPAADAPQERGARAGASCCKPRLQAPVLMARGRRPHGSGDPLWRTVPVPKGRVSRRHRHRTPPHRTTPRDSAPRRVMQGRT